MAGKKLTSLICISLIGIALLSLSLGFWLKSQRASLLNVKLGMPAWRIRIARIFNYDPKGHFGAQTQYLSTQVDAENGNYCIQCKQGKVSAIFVNYSQPITREQSLLAIQRLVDAKKVRKIDSSELSPVANGKSVDQFSKTSRFYCAPSEYIYYNSGKAAELQYVSPSDHRVTDLMVWG